MANNPTEKENGEVEEIDEAEYVTRSELSEAIENALKKLMGENVEIPSSDQAGFDTDPETVEPMNFSAGDIERIAEEKVQQALAKLTARRTAAQPAKKTTAAKKAAPKIEPEIEPTQPGKTSWSKKLWGTE